MEAVLFASAEPVATDKLAEILEIDKSTIEKIIHNLASRRNEKESGLKIVREENCWQLVTKAEFAPYVRKALEIRRNAPLTQAAMEVLSIVAYNQPVTKGYLEQVRGVDCSGTVNSLVQKDLIEERGRLDVPGKPIVYGTTLNFLKCFGLQSIHELPKIEEPEQENRQAE